MYVGLVVITLLGFLFSVILNELERIIVPWKALR
jgi:NitT/TauT family transport system permease protein